MIHPAQLASQLGHLLQTPGSARGHGGEAAHKPTPSKTPRESANTDRVEISNEARQAAGSEKLTAEEEKQVTELERRDREVRAHEQAHKSAGGQYAGAISYTYTTGPDGKRYASGGSVPIDSSPIEGNPRATVKKMQQVIRAANAPADPSAADRQVAARAAREMRKAQQQALDANIASVNEEKAATDTPTIDTLA